MLGMLGMGPTELVIVGIVAVLLFGSKLPEVARSLGASYRQFREGLSELQSQVQFDVHTPPPSPASSPTTSDDDEEDYTEPAAPKFEPPPAENSDANC